MILGRLCVSGVLVATLELPVFDASHIALLAPLLDEARVFGARGVVLDFGADARIAPETALALEALASSLDEASAPPSGPTHGSGVYRLGIDGACASLAICGLSPTSRATLEAEPRLAGLALADAWTDAVTLLTSRFTTVVPPRWSTAPARRTA